MSVTVAPLTAQVATSGRTRQVVIIGGHFDHLGTGRFGSLARP